MKYRDIIDQQVAVKHLLVKTASPPRDGITIVIRNNSITHVLDGAGWVHPSRKSQYTELFKNILKAHTLKDCNININLSDEPRAGLFNFCRYKGTANEFLLPGNRFTADDILPVGPTYDSSVTYLRSKWIPYESKSPTIYTSCIPHRSKLEYFNYALKNSFCKGYIYGGTVHKYMALEPSFIGALKEKGLAGEQKVPFEEHIRHKYVLYNDGNSLSDRMRLLLCTDSVLLHKSSPYEEFFTYLLKPNVNYIPYKAAEELGPIVKMLEANPELCAMIRKENSLFVNTYLPYDTIMEYTANLVNALF